ncbi:MAG TPA: cytochrome c oxidase subunit 3 [Pyrinomonadaceae bacterium]|jgi:cytochrome c oxidase subunit 3
MAIKTFTPEGETATRTETVVDVVGTRRRGGRGNGRGRGPGGGGGGPGGGGPGGGGGGDEQRRFSPERYRLGVLVGIASILMMFTALASAYVVRSGMATSVDWRGGQIPSFAYVSTALIVLSSLTFTRAKAALRHSEGAGYRLWLLVTLLLGLGFLAAQLLAWRQLVREGVYLASNPHSSFFYVLTGLHALHLLGGILALGALYLFDRRAGAALEAEVKRRALTDVVGIYWHFMDVLWVFLFLLLLFRR